MSHWNVQVSCPSDVAAEMSFENSREYPHFQRVQLNVIRETSVTLSDALGLENELFRLNHAQMRH